MNLVVFVIQLSARAHAPGKGVVGDKFFLKMDWCVALASENVLVRR